MGILLLSLLFHISFGRANTAPVIDSIIVSASSQGAQIGNINLIEGTTKSLYIYGQITEDDGCSQIQNGSLNFSFYRSMVTGGADCTVDPLNCYKASLTGGCELSGCTIGSETQVDYECNIAVQHFAQPTDAGLFAGQDWIASVTVTDDALASDTITSSTDIHTLRGLSISGEVDYGQLSIGSTTLSDAELTIRNTGNAGLDLMLAATDMNCESGVIESPNQKYSSASGQIYDEMLAFSTSSAYYDFSLQAQTDGTQSTSSLYMKLSIPTSTSSLLGVCTSTLQIVASEDI